MSSFMKMKESRPLGRRNAALLLGMAVAALSVACQREERRFSEPPPASRLYAKSSPVFNDSLARPNLARYAKDAWAIGEGQRLYAQMNCMGCHSHGGGGMGPPLMDSGWRYGSSLEDIARSIVLGRPNGMPSFADRLSPQQVWQVVAYVRSLSGHAPPDAAPVRDDHLAVRPPPSRMKPEPPVLEKGN
jgi:cytochrome c oxidase cbb3-type subunit 3